MAHGGPRTSADVARLALEDIIGPLASADEDLRVLLMKLSQWARTDYEADMIQDAIRARKRIRQARDNALKDHPNSRNGKEKR